MVLMNEIGTIARRRVSSRAFPQSPRQDVETNFDVENFRGIR